jgi:hypothetical protein
MVKKDYEIKTHTVTEKVCIKQTRFCDICNKEIPSKKGYWRLTTQHHDWGNDSVESIEIFDICSKKCMDKKYDEYMKKSNETEYNTREFEVAKRFNALGRVSDEQSVYEQSV